jgi:hypothetical protein
MTAVSQSALAHRRRSAAIGLGSGPSHIVNWEDKMTKRKINRDVRKGHAAPAGV